MLKAVLRKGGIVPLEPVPPEWEEGAALEVAKVNSEKSPSERQLSPPRGQSAAEVMAMLKTNKPAPDDATVKQWLDECGMEKYGQWQDRV